MADIGTQFFSTPVLRNVSRPYYELLDENFVHSWFEEKILWIMQDKFSVQLLFQLVAVIRNSSWVVTRTRDGGKHLLTLSLKWARRERDCLWFKRFSSRYFNSFSLHLFTPPWFSKAFDTIPRYLLFKKLLGYGINGKFFNNIKTLYSNDNCCIKVGRELTETFFGKSGG